MFGQSSRFAAYLPVVFTLLAAFRGGTAWADEPDAETPAVFELTVGPAAEPIPALKYHLLPPPEELVRGNAAPIYLRVIWEQHPNWHESVFREPRRLVELSLEELPLDEAKKAVSVVESALEQFAAAARRSDCNWEYVMEEDPLSTLLPDAQSMRNLSFALRLQSRVYVREKNPQAALASLGNGIALAGNVAKAPFLVTELIGLAISESTLGEVDAVVECEGAPNLYWALAELPSPLISFRRGLGTDASLLRDRFPELAVQDASIDWKALSQRMRNWAVEVARVELAASFGQQNKPGEDIETHVSPEKLAMARMELPKISDFTAEQVAAMGDAEVEVRYTVALHRVIYDQWRKWYYVPYDRVPGKVAEQTDQLREEAQRRELYPLVSVLAPLRGNLRLAQERVERLIARQQAIEALRMHAAAEGGFPKSLEEVTGVPAPVDPATGKPFLYKLDGEVAVLDVAELAGMTRESLRLPVRIKLRK
jgi:hypothetical protein